MAEGALHLIQSLGLEECEYILSLTAPNTRMGILGILAGILCLGDKNRLLETQDFSLSGWNDTD